MKHYEYLSLTFGYGLAVWDWDFCTEFYINKMNLDHPLSYVDY